MRLSKELRQCDNAPALPQLSGAGRWRVAAHSGYCRREMCGKYALQSGIRWCTV